MVFTWFTCCCRPATTRQVAKRSVSDSPRLHSLTGGEGQGGEGNEKCQISPNSVKNVCVYVYIYIYVMYIYIYTVICVYTIYTIYAVCIYNIMMSIHTFLNPPVIFRIIIPELIVLPTPHLEL